MSDYDDIEHLLTCGVWPNNKVPQWAELEAQRLGVLPTHNAIVQSVMKKEIERLTREREVYRKLAIREAMVGTLHWSREVAEKHVDDLAKEMEGRDE